MYSAPSLVSNNSTAVYSRSFVLIREVLQNEFRYDFWKCPREILAGTVITVLKAIMHVNTVNTVPAEI